MMMVRFRESFRERQMEFALAMGQTAWGLILLQPSEVFARGPFWTPLARMASEAVWGWGMFAVGLLSLVVLFINGAWRRTPFFRSLGSWVRLLVWTALLTGSLSLDWQSPTAAIYAMILFMEWLALRNASADLKRAAGHDAAL